MFKWQKTFRIVLMGPTIFLHSKDVSVIKRFEIVINHISDKYLVLSLFWIPISLFVNWLDEKYDLGFMDEILGSSEKERKVTINLTSILNFDLNF